MNGPRTPEGAAAVSAGFMAAETAEAIWRAGFEDGYRQALRATGRVPRKPRPLKARGRLRVINGGAS